MNIALSLICLGDEQIGHMPSDVVLIAHSVASENFLKSAKWSVELSYLDSQANLRSCSNQGTVTILPLDHRNHLRRMQALIL